MSTEEAEGEVVAQALEEPAEECAKCTTCNPVVLPQSPEEPEKACSSVMLPQTSEEPEKGPQCQSWVLGLLDDVRYLISCTNWY